MAVFRSRLLGEGRKGERAACTGIDTPVRCFMVATCPVTRLTRNLTLTDTTSYKITNSTIVLDLVTWSVDAQGSLLPPPPYSLAKYVTFTTVDLVLRSHSDSDVPRCSFRTIKRSLPGVWMKLNRMLAESSSSRSLY